MVLLESRTRSAGAFEPAPVPICTRVLVVSKVMRTFAPVVSVILMAVVESLIGSTVLRPTLPSELIMNRVVVATAEEEEATTKRGASADAFALPTESFAHAVEVPTPTLLLVTVLKIVVPEVVHGPEPPALSIVIGEPPIATNGVQVFEPVQVTVVVDTPPNAPLALYWSCPLEPDGVPPPLLEVAMSVRPLAVLDQPMTKPPVLLEPKSVEVAVCAKAVPAELV